MTKYSILTNKNGWLKNYRGHTFSDKLQNEIIKGVFEEHAKFKYNIPFLKNGIYEQLGKKCLIACIESNTKELLDVGSSSLLKDESTGIIIDNLILDNFGLWFAGIFRAPTTGASSKTLVNDADASKTVNIYGSAGQSTHVFNNSSDNGPPNPAYGTSIKMGSGTTPPARNNTKIQTSLPNAPESGYISTNPGAFTSNNTIIYQADANPTSGSGTVNEAGTFGSWLDTLRNRFEFMLTKDAVSPNVPYTAGKLLRAAYIWSI